MKGNLVTPFCVLSKWDQLIQWWIPVEGRGSSWLLLRAILGGSVIGEQESLLPLGVGKQRSEREYKGLWLLDAGPMSVFQFVMKLV